ncbi:ABC transporter substrate-binding protein [Natronosalvus caseinilyticus]|uniref:ABC transporter substrate-binding protein n=1 Tax=Natronosalvus caseinilyticus TaxID=2953747 RepID=UPI0028B23CE1|nr:ABC transporter substrate-binding protein [Natronosalvus caseinilyticus]
MGLERRTIIAATAGGVASTVLAGCLSERGPGAQESLEPDVDSVGLLLNWNPSGLHAPYFVAADRGFYEAEGIEEVTIESGDGSDFSAQQAGLGNVEFAITSSDQVLNVNSRELSPLAVGIVMQRNPVVVFAPRERFDGLSDPLQLAGTTVGSGPGMVRQMTEAFLEHHGVRESVEYVDSGFDTVQQVLTGEIDAAGGVFGDVVDAEQQGVEIDSLSVQEAVPSYGHLVATSEEFAANDPDAVRAFLRATARGAVWATQNPDDAIDVVVDAQPELEEVRENQREKWELMRTEYVISEAVREHGWGWSEPEPWESTYETLAAADFFADEIDPGSVWENEYLDAEYEYIGEYADLVME